MAQQQNKRRLIPIVDRSFQFKYTGVILVVAAVVSSVLGGFLWSAYQEMNELIGLAGLIPEVQSQMNAADTRFVFTLTFAFLVGEVAILGVLGLLITHRVCGPIFVITRHLDTLLHGAFPQLRPLRQGDEFVSMFDIFSRVVERLKKRDEDEIDRLQPIIAAARAKGLSDSDVATLQALVDERQARLAAR